MTETTNLQLQLLEASQAQKHVTVNEALVRLDAGIARRAISLSVATPPSVASDGDAYVIAPSPNRDWTGKEGSIAVWSNGGWDFFTPWAGLRLWIDDIAGWAVFDGSSWRLNALALSPGGALNLSTILEFDHSVVSGSTNSTAVSIPENSVVIGVSGRVLSEIVGPSSWQLGVADGTDRYGSGLGVAAGSYARGLTSSPLAYYSATPLVLSASGGDFGGGVVRLAVHILALQPPE